MIAAFGLAVVATVPIALRAHLRAAPLVALWLLYPLSLWIGYSIIGPGLGHTWHLLGTCCRPPPASCRSACSAGAWPSADSRCIDRGS